MKHPARKWLLGAVAGSMLLVGITLLAQSEAVENFYAQKIMLENTIRHRVSDAIFKITDNDRFVVDVKVFMDVQPGQTYQTEYEPEEPATAKPRTESTRSKVPTSQRISPTSSTNTPAAATNQPRQSATQSAAGTPPQSTAKPQKSQITNLDEILPGIPGVQRPKANLFDDVTQLPAPTNDDQPATVPMDTPAADSGMTAVVQDSSEKETETISENVTVTTPSDQAVAEELIPYEEDNNEVEKPRIRRHTVATSAVPVVKVKQVDITIILEDQVDPTTVENIRQVAMVASHFDRSRGDVLNIMTAAFKDDKTQSADAEQVLLKSIAERMVLIEKQQKEKAEADKAKVADEKAKQLIADQERLQKERDEIVKARQLEDERQKQRDLELKQQRAEEQRIMSLREEEMRKSQEAEQQRMAEERERLFALQRQQAHAQLKADSMRIALLESQLGDLKNQINAADVEEEHKLQLELEQRRKEQERSKLVEEQAQLSEKLQSLQEKPLTPEPLSAATDARNLYFILGGAALLILLLGLVFAAMNRRQPMPVYPDYPPAGKWSSDDERIDKAAEKAALQAETRLKDLLKAQRVEASYAAPEPERMTDEALSGGGQQSPAYRRPMVRTEDVARSEMDDVRKSVVSLAIGRPQSASRIINSWLQDSGGSATETASTSEADREQE